MKSKSARTFELVLQMLVLVYLIFSKCANLTQATAEQSKQEIHNVYHCGNRELVVHDLAFLIGVAKKQEPERSLEETVTFKALDKYMITMLP
jgi:hypothetical protein